MKMLNAALIIALTLTSGVALAERGSGDDNRIVFTGSTFTQHDSDVRHFSPSELPERNAK